MPPQRTVSGEEARRNRLACCLRCLICLFLSRLKNICRVGGQVRFKSLSGDQEEGDEVQKMRYLQDRLGNGWKWT